MPGSLVVFALKHARARAHTHTHTHTHIAGTSDQVLAALLKPAWERVLWKKLPYDDNYVDASFLESLVTNANFYTYDPLQVSNL